MVNSSASGNQVLQLTCPSCQHSNPPGARFCNNCGTALAKVKSEKTAPVDSSPPPVKPQESTAQAQIDSGPPPVKHQESIAKAPVDSGPPMKPQESAAQTQTNSAPHTEAQEVVAEAQKPALSLPRDCPSCGERNRVGILFCETCGTDLTGLATALHTRAVKEKLETLSKPKEPTGTSSFGDNMLLSFDIEGASELVNQKLEPGKDLLIGRDDPTNTFVVDIDLEPYLAHKLGVSRSHASIRLNGEQLELQDLDSANGTLLNGEHMIPYKAYVLHDGDEIYIARLKVLIRFKPQNTG